MGLIRLGLAEGVPTPRYAMGVAAGLDVLRGDAPASDEALLRSCWPDDLASGEVDLNIGWPTANGQQYHVVNYAW